MKIISSILVILILQLYTVWGSITSIYLPTKIFQEIQTCENDNFHHPISEHQVVSQIDCSRLCTSVGECRQFMFDKQTKLCSLFEAGENCFSAGDIQHKVCYRQKSVCNSKKCSRCPVGYYGDQCENIIVDCKDGRDRSVVPIKEGRRSYIQPSANGPVIEVMCDFKWGKTLLMRRTSLCKEVNFNRTWNEYVMGFGSIHGEYWLGLENVFNIIQNFPTRDDNALNVILKVGNTPVSQCYYMGFKISNYSDNYAVSISFYSGGKTPSGDSLTNGIYSINGRPFSTYDRDQTSHNCPGRFNGGWWYLDDPVCSQANIFGRRSGDTYESTCHWQEDFGLETDFSWIEMAFKRW
ncbi:hypothetical protein SNE40_011707 [Patella caerulea]|uniref:Fibrinogen C-terminal domain-containing protein n=1 Tax=Patella caerulea TaxID=87958 RepID=A0AAN8JSR6_PATCE